jgi:Flp pilus assembly pilin Flp
VDFQTKENSMSIGTKCGRGLWDFMTDDRGQDLIEYALLTAIIGVSGVLILSVIATRMGPAYRGWNTAAQNAWQPCAPQPAACP